MSSRWTNKYAIMRDLSIVQGCVPGEIEGTVGVGEKPPALDLVEETEEEFYRKYTSVDDSSVLMPDFKPIRMFLNMVDEDSPPDKDIEYKPERKFVVSKLNPECPEFRSKNLPSGDNNNNNSKHSTSAFANSKPESSVSETFCKNINKSRSPNGKIAHNKSGTSIGGSNIGIKATIPKKKRNIAIESIFEMESKENMTGKNVVDDTSTPAVIEKKTPTKKIEVKTPAKKVPPFLVDPSSMFKVKQCVKKEQVAPKQVNSPEKPVISIKKYVPTKQADEYYKKYVERSQIAKQAKEDIWARAERIMKEIDLKRKMEAELRALEESVAASKISSDSKSPKVDNSMDKSNENSTSISDESSIIQSNENSTDKVHESSIVDANDNSADQVKKQAGNNATLEANKENKNVQATENTNMSTDADIPSCASINDDSIDSNKIFDSSVASDIDSYNDNAISTESPPLYSSETSEGETLESPLPAREPYLTKHRHHFTLSSDCIVCQLLCKREENKKPKASTETGDILNWRIRDQL